MTYIENVFICMASPLLIAALCMGRRQAKFFLCCLAGMGACLLSAYINTFFAALYAADTIAVTAEIAPVDAPMSAHTLPSNVMGKVCMAFSYFSLVCGKKNMAIPYSRFPRWEFRLPLPPLKMSAI